MCQLLGKVDNLTFRLKFAKKRDLGLEFQATNVG